MRLGWEHGGWDGSMGGGAGVHGCIGVGSAGGLWEVLMQ